MNQSTVKLQLNKLVYKSKLLIVYNCNYMYICFFKIIYMKFSVQLHKIMTHFGLSTTELADKILVPKATISHLISERNRPSLEFIMKLHTHFPVLNLEWLIYGREPFLISNNNFEKPVVPSPLEVNKTEHPTETISTDSTATENDIPIEKKISSKKSLAISENDLSFETKSTAEIDSIIVFYRDGSFKRYIQQ